MTNFLRLQMQKVTDQSKMDQIATFLEQIDDDRDGQLKVDDVLKVLSKFTFFEMLMILTLF